MYMSPIVDKIWSKHQDTVPQHNVLPIGSTAHIHPEPVQYF